MAIAVPAEKNLVAIQFFSNFINDCPNHDFVAFHRNEKISHVSKN